MISYTNTGTNTEKFLREYLHQPFCNIMSSLFDNDQENGESVGMNLMTAPSFQYRNQRKVIIAFIVTIY